MCVVQGPVNFVSLETVNPSLQALAMAMSTVCIHVFGDVPSSPLVGLFQVWFLVLSLDFPCVSFTNASE